MIMSLFAIADLHLSFGTNKPMDIFSGWTDYVERLEKNWRSIVTQQDTVVIPGDISWAMKLEETFADFSFLQSLPGKKVFLKGNHDYWWGTKLKVEQYLMESGFDSISLVFNSACAVENYAVCGTRGWFYDAEDDADKKVLSREVGRLKMSLDAAEKTGLEPLVFLHYPPVYAEARCEEILTVLKERGVKRCFYGHVHGDAARRAINGMCDGIDFRLVACDNLQFTPYLIR